MVHDDHELLLRAAHGLTFALRDSAIFGERYLRLRPWLQRFDFFRELLDCPFCTSFWTGVLAYVLWRPAGFRWRRVPWFGFAAAAYGYETELRLKQLEEQLNGVEVMRHVGKDP
jgi:hypothetical protein